MDLTIGASSPSNLRPLILPASHAQIQHQAATLSASLALLENQQRCRSSSFTTFNSPPSSDKLTNDDDDSSSSSDESTDATSLSPMSDMNRGPSPIRPSTTGGITSHGGARSPRRGSNLHFHGEGAFPHPPPRSPSRPPDACPAPSGIPRREVKVGLLDPSSCLSDNKHYDRGEQLVQRAEAYRGNSSRSRSREKDARLYSEAAWDDRSVVDTLNWSRASMTGHSAATTETEDTDDEGTRNGGSGALLSPSEEGTPKQHQLRHAPSAWSLHAGKMQRRPSRTSLSAHSHGHADRPSTKIGQNDGVVKSTPQAGTETNDFEIAALRREVEQLRMALVQKSLGEGDGRPSLDVSGTRSSMSLRSCRTFESDRKIASPPKPAPSDPLPAPPRQHDRSAPAPAYPSVVRQDYRLNTAESRQMHYDSRYDGGFPGQAYAAPHPRDRYASHQGEAYDFPQQLRDDSSRRHRRPSDQAYSSEHYLHRQPFQPQQYPPHPQQYQEHQHVPDPFPHGGRPSYISGPPSTAWPDESVSQAGSGEEGRKVDELAKKVEALEALLRPAAGGGGERITAAEAMATATADRGSTSSSPATVARPLPSDKRIYAHPNGSLSSYRAGSPASAFVYNATASSSFPARSSLDLSTSSNAGSCVGGSSTTATATAAAEAGKKKKKTISSMFKLGNSSGADAEVGERTRGDEIETTGEAKEMMMTTTAVSWSRKRTEKTQVPKTKIRQGPGRGRVYIAPSKG